MESRQYGGVGRQYCTLAIGSNRQPMKLKANCVLILIEMIICEYQKTQGIHFPFKV